MTLITTTDELALILNCINEALEIVDPGRFRARTGHERDRALLAHSDLSRTLDERDIATGPADQDVRLDLVDEDVRLIAACISQALALVEDWEFQTRTGSTPADAERLRGELDGALGSGPNETGRASNA